MRPQHMAVPFATAQVLQEPIETETAPVASSGMAPGTRLMVSAAPAPSTSSWLFSPQHFTAPFTTAHAVVPPMLMSVTPEVSPTTVTGTSASVVISVPRPRIGSARSVPPMHFASPLVVTAQTRREPNPLAPPTYTFAMPLSRPATGAGVEPAPLPQHVTAPAAVTAHAAVPCAAMDFTPLERPRTSTGLLLK